MIKNVTQTFVFLSENSTLLVTTYRGKSINDQMEDTNINIKKTQPKTSKHQMRPLNLYQMVTKKETDEQILLMIRKVTAHY